MTDDPRTEGKSRRPEWTRNRNQVAGDVSTERRKELRAKDKAKRAARRQQAANPLPIDAMGDERAAVEYVPGPDFTERTWSRRFCANCYQWLTDDPGTYAAQRARMLADHETPMPPDGVIFKRRRTTSTPPTQPAEGQQTCTKCPPGQHSPMRHGQLIELAEPFPSWCPDCGHSANAHGNECTLPTCGCDRSRDEFTASAKVEANPHGTPTPHEGDSAEVGANG